MLVADGLTGFLSEPVVIGLFQTVTDHFGAGELAFNDYGRSGWAGQTARKLARNAASRASPRSGTTRDLPTGAVGCQTLP
jgi:O-methyltransferase involved in polyketide biosynthesis